MRNQMSEDQFKSKMFQLEEKNAVHENEVLILTQIVSFLNDLQYLV